LDVALKVPVAQVVHTRSSEAEGVFEMYVPAAQVLQDVQEAALVPVLYWPPAQAVHARSTVAEGVFDT
jgi:hypothetical protein